MTAEMQVERKPHTEYDEPTRDRILDLRMAGASYIELGKTFGIPKSTIHMWERRYREDGRDWHRAPRMYKESMICEKEFREYLDAHPGIPVRKIAKHFKCHKTTIYNTLKRYNIKHSVPRPARPVKRIDFAGLEAYVAKNPDAAVQDIAKRFGCTFTMAREAIHRYKGTRKPKTPIRAMLEEIKDYLRCNPAARPKQIAIHFGYSEGAVYRLLRQENIPYVKQSALSFVNSEEYTQIYHGLRQQYLYSTELKTEAVRRVVEGECMRNVADDLGVSHTAVSRWHKIFLSNMAMMVKKKDLTLESLDTLFFMQQIEMLELEFLKKVVGEFVESLDAIKKSALVKKYSGNLGNRRACTLLKTQPDLYYYWRDKTETAYERNDREDTEKIKEIFNKTGKIYGARKMVSALKASGVTVGQVRMSRLMKEAGLKPLRRKKRTPKPSEKKIAIPNLLQRDFRANYVNQVWATDITYIFTDEGRLYLCCVLDLCSRRIVGYAIDRGMTTKCLTIAALSDAVNARKPTTGFIVHSDRGSQFTSEEFRLFISQHKGIQSMSNAGSPADNACIESFFNLLKSECVYRQHFTTRQQAHDALVKYIDFYNNERLHSKLNNVSPSDFENLQLSAPLSFAQQEGRNYL